MLHDREQPSLTVRSVLVLLKKSKGSQECLLNEILGFIRIARQEQTETIECIKAWKGRFFEQPTLLPIHEETLGFRKMPCFSKKIERPLKESSLLSFKTGRALDLFPQNERHQQKDAG
jgi:hypothetical protein